jgi:hypothetical protein
VRQILLRAVDERGYVILRDKHAKDRPQTPREAFRERWKEHGLSDREIDRLEKAESLKRKA